MLMCRQEQILKFIANFPQPYPPTVREICDGVGLNSSATVHGYLDDLEVMGFIERKTQSPSCIKVKKVI
ncbi:MAG: helix-turn-helix domain-containing protein [Pelosinus sp.]|nr:helix-turn-helix domain-containing protein [Pelosinus sp.]